MAESQARADLKAAIATIAAKVADQLEAKLPGGVEFVLAIYAEPADESGGVVCSCVATAEDPNTVTAVLAKIAQQTAAGEYVEAGEGRSDA